MVDELYLGIWEGEGISDNYRRNMKKNILGISKVFFLSMFSL